MITAVFYHDNLYGLTGFSIKGHAGLDLHGKDILCAAVSSTAEFAIHLLCDCFGVKCSVSIDKKTSKVTCKITPAAQYNDKKEQISGVLKGYFNYLSELSKEYPENLTCSITERNE